MHATPTTPASADLLADPARLRSMAAHPCCQGRRDELEALLTLDDLEPSSTTGEDGSMATEYGLIIVVAATICSLVISWASGGGVFDILGKVVESVSGKLF